MILSIIANAGGWVVARVIFSIVTAIAGILRLVSFYFGDYEEINITPAFSYYAEVHYSSYWGNSTWTIAEFRPRSDGGNSYNITVVSIDQLGNWTRTFTPTWWELKAERRHWLCSLGAQSYYEVNSDTQMQIGYTVMRYANIAWHRHNNPQSVVLTFDGVTLPTMCNGAEFGRTYSFAVPAPRNGWGPLPLPFDNFRADSVNGTVPSL